MNKVFGHFKTITAHRHAVIRHCIKAGIPLQGLRHDLSKYTPAEFIPGCRYYSGDRSPNERERELYGYSRAWLHHRGRNKHHFEYWFDYNPAERRNMPVKMPLKYVAEMFCDRVAASKIYQGERYTDAHPLMYFEKGKDIRLIHPQTSDFLERPLTMLRDEGEDATFSYLRSYLSSHDDY